MPLRKTKRPIKKESTAKESVALLAAHLCAQRDTSRAINSMLRDVLDRTRFIERIADAQPNVRRMIATHLLGHLARRRPPDATHDDHHKMAKEALSLADALIAMDREDRRVRDINRTTRNVGGTTFSFDEDGRYD